MVDDAWSNNHQIKMYTRFRDDIVLACKGQLNNAMVYRQMILDTRGQYEVRCEAISKTVMENLDVQLSKSSSGKVVTKPFFKTTEQKVPLTVRSLHPRHVHSSWPVANIFRLRALSSNARVFFAARKRYALNTYCMPWMPMPSNRHPGSTTPPLLPDPIGGMIGTMSIRCSCSMSILVLAAVPTAIGASKHCG